MDLFTIGVKKTDKPISNYFRGWDCMFFLVGYFCGVWEYGMVANAWREYAHMLKEMMENEITIYLRGRRE